MLVVSRQLGERLVVGDSLVEVVSIRNGRVRLGVTAPKEVRIRREEIPSEAPATKPLGVPFEM